MTSFEAYRCRTYYIRGKIDMAMLCKAIAMRAAGRGDSAAQVADEIDEKLHLTEELLAKLLRDDAALGLLRPVGGEVVQGVERQADGPGIDWRYGGGDGNREGEQENIRNQGPGTSFDPMVVWLRVLTWVAAGWKREKKQGE